MSDLWTDEEIEAHRAEARQGAIAEADLLHAHARVAALEAERASWLEQARIAIDRVVRVAKERDDLRGLLKVLLDNSTSELHRDVAPRDAPGLFTENDLPSMSPLMAITRAIKREPAA